MQKRAIIIGATFGIGQEVAKVLLIIAGAASNRIINKVSNLFKYTKKPHEKTPGFVNAPPKFMHPRQEGQIVA